MICYRLSVESDLFPIECIAKVMCLTLLVFTYAVMPRGSSLTYVIRKRYSQFCELNTALQADITPLAPKGLQFAFVDSRYQMRRPTDEARREMLYAWIVGIVYEPKFMLNNSIFKKVTEFFEYFEHIVEDDIIRGVSVPTLFR